MLAVIGVRSFLDGSFQRISAPEWDQIGGLDKTVHRMARDLVRERLDHEPAPAVDYNDVLHALSEDADPAIIDRIVASFPPAAHDAATAFLAQLGKALRFLRGKLPISTYRDVFGAENLPPAETQVFAFEDLLELVDRPLAVFEMVDTGHLTSEMAVALMQLYPTLYAKVVGEIVVRCAVEKAEHPNAFDPKFGPALAVLLAVPGVDPELRQQLQAPKPQTQQQEPQQQQNSNTQAKRLAPKSAQPDLENT